MQTFKLSDSKVPAKQYLSNKIIMKRLESLVLESLITISDKKQGIIRNSGNNSLA